MLPERPRAGLGLVTHVRLSDAYIVSTSFLFLVVRPLFLVAMPGAPSSVLLMHFFPPTRQGCRAYWFWRTHRSHCSPIDSSDCRSMEPKYRNLGGTGVFFSGGSPETVDATNGAAGLNTNGAIGRYERGSWHHCTSSILTTSNKKLLLVQPVKRAEHSKGRECQLGQFGRGVRV